MQISITVDISNKDDIRAAMSVLSKFLGGESVAGTQPAAAPTEYVVKTADTEKTEPVSSDTTTKTFTQEQVRAALKAYAIKHSREAAVEKLNVYAKVYTDVAPADYAKLMADLA